MQCCCNSNYVEDVQPRPSRNCGMTLDMKNRMITTATTVMDLARRILSEMQYCCSSSANVLSNLCTEFSMLQKK